MLLRIKFGKVYFATEIAAEVECFIFKLKSWGGQIEAVKNCAVKGEAVSNRLTSSFTHSFVLHLLVQLMLVFSANSVIFGAVSAPYAKLDIEVALARIFN